MESSLVEIGKIEIPEKYRREKSGTATIEDRLLQQSIKAVGLRFPIRLKENGVGYILIDGFRRLMAFKALRFEKIPAYILDRKQAEDTDIIRFQANVQRENLKPLDEAKLLRNLITEDGLKREDVARMVGKDVGTVDRFLALLKLVDRWQKLVNDGALSLWDVKPLPALSSRGQRYVYDEIRKRSIPFSRDTILAVSSALNPTENPEFFQNPKAVASARINEKIGHPVRTRKVEGIAERRAMTRHYQRTLQDYEEKISLSLPVIRQILASKDACEVLLPSTLKGFREVAEEYL